MRVLIVGGGISAVYIANNLKKRDHTLDVTIISDEKYPPYDRIHLCRLVDDSKNESDISLPLDPTIKVELNQKINQIDKTNKHIYSNDSMFSYDKLIIATGSVPVTLFDISDIKNAAVFRSADDCELIKNGVRSREVVVVGGGPIGLELLETLNVMDDVEKITLILRARHLYDKDLSDDSIKIIEECYLKGGKVRISYEDTITQRIVEDGEIKLLKTKKLEIKDPFLIFGTGIKPNIDNFRDSIMCNKGILTNLYMQSDDKDIYAVGECAEVKELDFVAGHVKECISQADCAISHMLGDDKDEFSLSTTIDLLKVGGFNLTEVRSSNFSKDYEKILISSQKDKRVDEYFVKKDKLVRFIGINTNVDIGFIETLIKNGEKLDINYLYEHRLVGDRGELVCSCVHAYYKDLVNIVKQNAVRDFYSLSEYSQAGRVCGRCKNSVIDIIEKTQELIDPSVLKESLDDSKDEILKVKKTIEKFNKLHPRNKLTSKNLQSAMDSLEIEKKDVNSWISMVTANMRLHPDFEEVVEKGVEVLNKIPIIWLELADCSGNSEAFIKSTNPAIEDLIFDYISLDYHELIMSASGDQSESVLEDII